MKTILIFISMFLLLSATSAFSEERFDAKTWRTVQTYDVVALKKIESSLLGQIVGVRFNYRQSRVRHIKPNWYAGSVWQYRPGEKKKDAFTFVRVIVPKADLPGFESFPTDFQSRGELVCYGRVSKDVEANFVFVRLLGRKATLDPSGHAVVGW